ncbi:ABC transporter substrate-binding protein [Actinosynnema sp. ALI-1.44]|uniref:ABC transporter substrate-binding protein n=1 Tax=Actinosynnema sp. ALI-1.44 TaxID=1933779 RepID=UPI00143D6555|nr:ABC transporter substrate-binding protein [Actinosynnema sp. ALI-1.44]
MTATASCAALGGSAETPQGGGDLEKPTIKVADLKIIDSAPIRLAVDKGHFKAEGLNVELTTGGKGSVNVDNVIGGSIDIGLTSYPPAIAAVVKGKNDIKIVADAMTTTENLFLLVVAKDGAVRTVKDLIGKKIGVSSKGGIGELALRSQMAINGVIITNEQYFSMPFADMPAALERNDIQAAIMNEPFLTQTLQAKGVSKLLSPFSGSTADFPTSGWIAKRDFVEKNPKTLAAFQRAMAKAVQDAQDRGTVEAAVVKYVGVPPNVASLMTMPVFSSSTDARRFQRVVDLMKETGELPKGTDLDMRTMVTDPQ